MSGATAPARRRRGAALDTAVLDAAWDELRAVGYPRLTLDGVAARAGTSPRVPHDVYLHCISGQEDTVSQRIQDAPDAGTGITHSPPGGKASGYTHRRHHPGPCPLYVREPVPGPAHSSRPSGPADPQYRMQTPAATSVSAGHAACEVISAEAGRCPDLAHA